MNELLLDKGMDMRYIYLIFFCFILGCAGVSAPVHGGLITSVTYPLEVTSNEVASKKMGVGYASTILGIIALGDAGVESTAKKAGITRISHIDIEAFDFLYIFASYTVKVYGE